MIRYPEGAFGFQILLRLHGMFGEISIQYLTQLYTCTKSRKWMVYWTVLCSRSIITSSLNESRSLSTLFVLAFQARPSSSPSCQHWYRVPFISFWSSTQIWTMTAIKFWWGIDSSFMFLSGGNPIFVWLISLMIFFASRIILIPSEHWWHPLRFCFPFGTWMFSSFVIFSKKKRVNGLRMVLFFFFPYLSDFPSRLCPEQTLPTIE